MNTTDLMNSFVVMGKGVGGIFVVMIVIALIVTLLAKVTNLGNKNKNDSDDE